MPGLKYVANSIVIFKIKKDNLDKKEVKKCQKKYKLPII